MRVQPPAHPQRRERQQLGATDEWKAVTGPISTRRVRRATVHRARRRDGPCRVARVAVRGLGELRAERPPRRPGTGRGSRAAGSTSSSTTRVQSGVAGAALLRAARSGSRTCRRPRGPSSSVSPRERRVALRRARPARSCTSWRSPRAARRRARAIDVGAVGRVDARAPARCGAAGARGRARDPQRLLRQPGGGVVGEVAQARRACAGAAPRRCRSRRRARAPGRSRSRRSPREHLAHAARRSGRSAAGRCRSGGGRCATRSRPARAAPRSAEGASPRCSM